MKLLLLLSLICFTRGFAQPGFSVLSDRKTTIKFQFINNLILIPVSVNGTQLTFLLDSGVSETILFSLGDETLDLKEVEKIKFSGLGESRQLEGLRAVHNTLMIGKSLQDSDHTIYLIPDESINFSSHIGIAVHGIIGYHFFKNHPVQIDYGRRKITVYKEPQHLPRNLARFKKFDLSIEGNKPYLQTQSAVRDDFYDTKMLLDLGNSDGVWLFPKYRALLPSSAVSFTDYLGRGFNGDIYGQRSRIKSVQLGDFHFNKPLAAFPDSTSLEHLKMAAGRSGSIGNEILRRFTIVFDYPDQHLYLKKNSHYRDPFRFNSSGMEVQHSGMEWQKDVVRIQMKPAGEQNPVYESQDVFRYNFVLKPVYSIAGCRKDSPCDIAGLRKNDQIESINRQKTANMTLQKINDLLKGEDGTQLRFEVRRAGELLKSTVTLKDPLPYED